MSFIRIFNKKAFSLVEVLAGILVLVSLIAIVVQLSYGNNRRIKKARQLRKSAELLEIKMTELTQEFQGKNIAKLLTEDEGEFNGEENYFWSYQTQPFQLPDNRFILSLMKLPDNQLNQQMISFFKSVLSDTVLELKLTVAYKPKKGKESSYSLTAYFVDYNAAPDIIAGQISSLIPQGASL